MTLPKSLADTLGSFKWVVGNNCIGEQPEQASDIAPNTGLFWIGAAAAPPVPPPAGIPCGSPDLFYKKTQTISSFRNYLLVKASSAEACKSLRGSGTVKAGSETIGKLTTVTRAAGASISLKLKLPHGVLTKALAALDAGKKTKALVKVTALDSSGGVLAARTGTVTLRN